MTNPVIQSVRKSLGRSAEDPLSPRPDVLKPRQPGTLDAEIRLFLDEVNKLSGVGQRIDAEQIGGALSDLVAEHSIAAATVWDTPLLERLGLKDVLSSLGVELVSPNAGKLEMARCDLGLTEADFLLPETGTLVLRSSLERPRGVSLLPRIHLAVVLPEMLRADMHQVFAEANDSPYLVFITGPSRTSDIELTVTLGVHGPKNLYVWMVEEPPLHE